MKRIALAAIAAFGSAAASATGHNPPAPSRAPVEAATRVEVRDDLGVIMRRAHTPGAFVLYDVSNNRMVMVDRPRAERRFIPASTYKIPHSLIAFETGVVKDESEVVPYGGKPQPFKTWEQDMNLRDAIRASNVPVYQEVARRIGRQRMQQWVGRLRYGNRNTGTVVDRFWLDGPLAISAVEQVQFLAQLAQGRLPAAQRNQGRVRDILRVEKTAGSTLYAKTGWAFCVKPQIGWWVGWVERGGRLHCFALNIDMAGAADAPKRAELGRELLKRLGVL